MRRDQLPALYQAAKALGLAKPNIGLLTDMIACPGGDFCSLANARSLPIAEAITERYQDLDELWDLGEIDLHISGCINSCGHHHSGHIGILGVDKGRQGVVPDHAGRRRWLRPVGPCHAGQDHRPLVQRRRSAGRDRSLAEHLPHRAPAMLADDAQGPRYEKFIDTVRRVGLEPFKTAANAARRPLKPKPPEGLSL